ncbi:Putative Dynein heavy chain 1, cytosolic [Rhizopus microsporus]|nr:Putative Dynein heavy chain 1, cytosolic [Rhizopus microsporus]
MNPGYAGRSNLPDNLKKLFRSMAMTKPDRELIAQVMLYSQGFRTAEVLASKVVPLFNLCAEQLSPQSHYDFGLRALKSVLVSAGNLKRDRLTQLRQEIEKGEVDQTEYARISEPIPEQQLLISSIRETVEPKLVADDIPLLTSLLADVFPGVHYAPGNLDRLKEELRKVCEERRLVPGDAWMEKVIQLYQIQNIHHGLMMVGPSGAGKSTAWKTLLTALERVEGVEGIAYTIDPKAIPKDALYGTLDSTTREWTDGLFTHILRKIVDNVRGESQKRHWIIFDGDVDPEWVENLNSVLDDNRLLTLPNGERLNLPPNVRIMFEVETLKYATLATVSRCGMVWFSEDIITLPMIFSNYLDTLRNVPMDEIEEEGSSSRRRTESGGAAANGATATEGGVSPNLHTQRAIADIMAPDLSDENCLVAKCLTNTIMQEVDQTTAIYTPLAHACSSIFFAMEQLNLVNHFYQFSLDFFYEIFEYVIHANPNLKGISDPDRRLEILSRDLFSAAYKRASRSLIHEDYPMYAVLLCQIRMRGVQENVDDTEFDFLLNGGDSVVGNTVTAASLNLPSFIPDEIAQRIKEFSNLNCFSHLVNHVSMNEDVWKQFMEHNQPETIVPLCWDGAGTNNSVDALRKMLIVKCFRPDRLLPATTIFATEIFDGEFMNTGELNLQQIVTEEVGSSTPLALCSVPGYDASYRVDNLVAETNNRCTSVAMGSAEGFGLADQAISAAIKTEASQHEASP